MKKVLDFIKRWLNLDHQRPWEHSTIRDSKNKQGRQETKKDI